MVRMVPRLHKKKRWKVVLFWVVASFFMLLGSIIASQLQSIDGANEIAFILAFAIAFMFFLLATLFLFSVSIALRKIDEE